MKTKLIVISVFFFSVFCYKSQECGSVLPSGYFQKHFPPHTATSSGIHYPQDTCLHRMLSVVFHVVLDSSGSPGINLADLPKCIDTLNKFFKPICITFKSCSTNFVPNYNYNNWNQPIHEPTMLSNYYVDSTINIYIVQNLIVPGAAGYAHMPGTSKDVIVINKNSITNLVPVHEMGHYFGLPHTFETSNGAELVMRTNCYTAGDGFCDTEADCYPIGNSPGLATCDFIYGPQDANGVYYTPPVDNIMTYFKPCIRRFTQEQYNFMAYIYITARYYLH